MYGVEYLCLTELLDQDPSAYEFFLTLSPEARALLEEVRKMGRSVPGRAGAEAETEAPRRDGVAPEMAGALDCLPGSL